MYGRTELATHVYMHTKVNNLLSPLTTGSIMNHDSGS